MQTPSILRQERNNRIDAWLADGGIVLASSERAARSITAAYHDARQAEGRSAWHSPAIFSWETWLQTEWEARDPHGLLLLNPLQEKSLWLDAILKSGRYSWLANPGRLAASAQRAYQLVCGYAPASLKSSARSGWQSDAAEFSRWLDAFESRCRREGLLSRSRLALNFAELLSGDEAVLSQSRPALLLVGFDRLLASQESLLDAWGHWEPLQPTPGKSRHIYYESNDSAQETRSCVAWLRQSLQQNPASRLMVVVAGLEARRGELERELLSTTGLDTQNTPLDFEFSLGVPLAQMSHARSALLLLQWLTAPISEAEVDWLLGSGHIVANPNEEQALAQAMQRIRRRGRERPSWRIHELTHDLPQASASPEGVAASSWAARFTAATGLLAAMPKRQSPLAWVEATRALLEAAGWPGYHSLSSVAFQVCERWQRVLDDCGSLGFDDRAASMEWDEFAAALADAVRDTVFAAESSDAPIQITGPLESAGQVADGIWFLGADENGWPGGGQPHPLLPIGLQRDAGMPHSSPQADWNLAQEATLRLISSAEEVTFSYALQNADTETRPSRLALRLLGAPTALPQGSHPLRLDETESFTDTSRIPFPHQALRGGSGILTSQSNCPFLAFATGRLEAEAAEPASTGLNARQRGILLHNLLHRVWAGAGDGPERGGISTHSELLVIPSLREFVDAHVRHTMHECFDQSRKNALPDRFPARYLDLESERLTRLVIEWLEYERKRHPFTVAKTEVDSEITVAGLSLRLRLDRIDVIETPQGNTASLVIDYKSSVVGPKVWAGERPENVQLPLYATFALPESQQELEGLAIAQVRPANMKFDGRVREAATTLLPDLGKASSMVKNPLTDEQLDAWRSTIERLGKDFIAGHAEVDPREPGKTCEHCHLHAVCRINESELLNVVAGEDDAETEGEGAHD